MAGLIDGFSAEAAVGVEGFGAGEAADGEVELALGPLEFGAAQPQLYFEPGGIQFDQDLVAGDALSRRDAAGGDLPAHLQRQIGLTQGFEGGGKAHQVRSLALGQHDDVVARLCGERCG